MWKNKDDRSADESKKYIIIEYNDCVKCEFIGYDDYISARKNVKRWCFLNDAYLEIKDKQ